MTNNNTQALLEDVREYANGCMTLGAMYVVVFPGREIKAIGYPVREDAVNSAARRQGVVFDLHNDEMIVDNRGVKREDPFAALLRKF